MRQLLPLIACCLFLASCASSQQMGAARDVHALLVSIRDDDVATFDAHVDRPALQRELQSRMASEIRGSKADGSVKLLGLLLGPAVSQVAGDMLIQPYTFRLVAESYGYKASQPIPGPMYIAQALRPLDENRVCAVAKKDGPCLLIFSRYPGDAWRLSGFEGELSMLKKAF